MKKILALIFLLQTGLCVIAQHQDIAEKPPLWKAKEKQTGDTVSLLQAFKKGIVHGHFRYFFMATDNKAGLSDYHANAIGGAIKYETARFKGFQFGVSGSLVFNIGSSDLSVPDPKTNQPNRYELGLFDVTDPANKKNIDRLEELYLKYSWKQSQLTFGKQLINTPFINLQDGRMRPTEAGGVYSEINALKNTRFEGGYLYEIAPRSTVKWYQPGKSIGLYPQGVNPDGTKSAYKNNLNSKGIILFGITQKFKQAFSVQLSDVYASNIFNTLLLQADYRRTLSNSSKLLAAVQFIRQDALKDGGNADPSKTYFIKGGKSNTFGIRMGWETTHLQTSINYTRITAHGRYLMPREWGRDPFFTFLPRERNEGLGDVHAYVLKAGYAFQKIRMKFQAAAGYYKLPDVTNYRLNKYAMPSYTQLNIDIRYGFAGFLKGMETQLLYVHKGRSGNTYGNEKYVINKVNVSVWNCLLNYHF